MKESVAKIPNTGYSVEWSPFNDSLLAVGTAQHFGVIGTGALCIYSYNDGYLKPFKSHDTADGVYDCAWSEAVENQIALGTGDGSVELWDMSSNTVLQTWKEHSAEVYALAWSPLNTDQLVSGSWDHTLKLWSAELGRSLRTFASHSGCVYSVRWHPQYADMFASASGDLTVKLWDANEAQPALTFKAHDFEVLTCDWSKYDPNTLYTGSVDKTVRVWDIRALRAPVKQLGGHEFAVRRVKACPHDANMLLSTSYDMSAAVWSTDREDALVGRHEEHTEFVVGCDWNLFHEGLVATCAWDETLRVWNVHDMPR